MSMWRTVTLLALATSLLVGGCKKDAAPAAPAEPGAVAAAPTTPESPAADEEPQGTGIDNPTNAPELVALAKQVAECEYKQRIDPRTCEAFKAFAEKAMELAPPLGFKTMLNLLADESPGLRYAAANTLRLRNFGGRPFEDAELLDAVLGALASEEDAKVLDELGGVVGKFRLNKTGGKDEVLKVLREHPRTEARTGMLLHILFANRDVPDVFETVRDIARSDENEDIKRAAIGAFWNIGNQRREEIVTLWREALRWPQDKAASHAAYMLGHWNKGVAEAFDDVVAETARRAEDGTLSWEYLSGLYWYVYNAQEFVDRVKVFDLLHGIAKDNRHRWNVRNRAMSIMKDTGDGRLLAALEPLKSDAEMLVAKHAERVLAE